MPLLAQTPENQRLKEETLGHLYEYAKVGLRTLMICEKEIDPSWYRKWQSTYENARISINNKE